jgi:hypothetical protein
MLLEMPQWVQVWFWMRFLREPKDWTPLPHQGINPDAMTMDQYQALEEEWLKASVRPVSTAEVVMAMTGNPIVDDDEIPF